MTVTFRQFTYRVPGVYQWSRPPTGAGAGPFGSTYLQTIVTVIGPGSGGKSGAAGNNQDTAESGGYGGNGGGYAQGMFVGAAGLTTLEDVVVGVGTQGGAAVSASGSGTSGLAPNDSLGAFQSRFGTNFITCTGGGATTSGVGGAVNFIAGTNQISFIGGTGIAPSNILHTQISVGPGVSGPSGPTWNVTGNNAGAAGGSAIGTVPLGTNGGGVYPIGGGGTGVSSTSQPAQSGGAPGAGGGGSCANSGVFPLTAGNGADAKPNSGAGGGGGGGAASLFLAGGGLINAGAGGRGSDGVVQVTDIFTLPPITAPYYFNFDIVTWYHMMNQARPISVTGRFAS